MTRIHVPKKRRQRKQSVSKVVVAARIVTLCISHQASQAFTVPSTNHLGKRYPVKLYPKGGRRLWQSCIFSDASKSDDAGSSSSTHHASHYDTKEDNNNVYKWKVGNVYEDLDRLQREITISNAEQHLRQVQDRERLDTFATNRRPIHGDVRQFVVAPLILSLCVSMLSKFSRTTWLSQVFTSFFDLHLILIMVAPMLLLVAKRKSLPPPLPRPLELKGLDSEYYRFVVTDWEDPKTSCRDVVLCLLENWTSAVVGPAILYILLPLFKSSTTRGVSVATCQLITRLGAIAALHQYPKLLYQLQRRHQPRPMDRYTMRLQQLVWLALSLAPLGIASDLTKLWSQLSAKLVALLISLGLIPYAKHRLIRGTIPRPLTRRSALFQSLAYLSMTVTQLASIWTLGGMLLKQWRVWKPTATCWKVIALSGVSLSVLLAG